MNPVRTLFVLIVVLACMLVLCGGAVAEQQVGKAHEVVFTTRVQIAGSPLDAGTYKVTHVMDGQQHVLVFVSGGKNRTEHRFKCQMKQLTAKAPYSEQHFIEDSSGKRIVTSLVFQGEQTEHVF